MIAYPGGQGPGGVDAMSSLMLCTILCSIALQCQQLQISMGSSDAWTWRKTPCAGSRLHAERL